MDMIIKERGLGETTSAIQEAYWRGLPLVCTDEASKKHHTDMAKRMGYDIDVITANECAIRNGRYDEVVVDDADFVLEKCLGVKISLATFNR